MKKFLIGTTALVAAGVIAAPGAQAAEKIKLGLGGFMHNFVGYSSNDTNPTANNQVDRDGVDVKSSNEIYFTGSTKLDNGITVSAVVQMESDHGDTGDDQDEVYMKLDSADLGTLFIGGTKTATFQARHAAPNVSNIGMNAGHVMANQWVPYNGTAAIALAGGGAGGQGSTGGDARDTHKIGYFTPRFAGFRLGASYTPDLFTTNSTQPNDHTTSNMSDVTVDYDGKIGDVALGVNVAYQQMNGHDNTVSATLDNTAGMTLWTAGISASVAGFTVGGSYQDVNQDNGNLVLSLAGQTWDAGISYATGPYSVSLTYAASEAEGLVATTGEDKSSIWLLGGKYNLGPGVDLNAAIIRGDWEDEGTGANNDSEAWAVATGIALSF